MIIEVKSYFVGHHIPSSDRRLDGDKWNLPEGASVAEVLEILNLPEERAKIILVNGHYANKDKVLNEGDVLQISPLLTGG
jgi:sulfur carrier protein ThiS